MGNRLTTEQFVERSSQIHDNYYQYPDEYVKLTQKIRIVCPIHGEFFQTPKNHIIQKSGCSLCNIPNIKTTTDFISQAQLAHNGYYEYPDPYINGTTKIRIVCPIHGDFFQSPDRHIHGPTKCPNCCKKDASTFIHKSNSIHNHRYDYSLVEYTTAHDKVKIICSKHGVFSQTPNSHLNGCGCPSCCNNYSNKCISWLETLMLNERIYIQHALNGGEFRIPGTKYKADGYCRETNTVYEFHGDRFHGNPKLFGSEELCHPFCDLTAGELYDNTIRKENRIRELGYHLVVKWETE